MKFHILHKWEHHKTMSTYEYLGEPYGVENNSFRFCRKCGRVERWVEQNIKLLLISCFRMGGAHWRPLNKDEAKIYMRLKC